MPVVHRFKGHQGRPDWEDVPTYEYTQGGARGGLKKVLIGSADGAPNFSLRYYEIAPGGQSSFDHHAHDHGVYILQGRAKLIAGWEVVELEAGDVVYIGAKEEHQFINIGQQPLGFICVAPPRD